MKVFYFLSHFFPAELKSRVGDEIFLKAFFPAELKSSDAESM